MKRICVFCGSNSGTKPVYLEAACRLGTLLAERGFGLVYGGASIGLMGAVADAALEAGGEVIGVIPEHLSKQEVSHIGLTDLRVVTTMHERKALMESLSDGFIALPGGYGTMDELFEILTWAQLGFHQKPVGILNIDDYYSPLLNFLDYAVAQQFIKEEFRNLLHEAREPETLLKLFELHKPVKASPWYKEPAASELK